MTLVMPAAQVPKVLWKYTAQQVLTMEYAPGVKINRTAEIERMGVDRKELARRTVECYLQQLLTYGFFHAGVFSAPVITDCLSYLQQRV
jgi:predicted unusual protein kinase regulating ubiquinone biosynthesis (AarF/ABC1/UbiB family)